MDLQLNNSNNLISKKKERNFDILMECIEFLFLATVGKENRHHNLFMANVFNATDRVCSVQFSILIAQNILFSYTNTVRMVQNLDNTLTDHPIILSFHFVSIFIFFSFLFHGIGFFDLFCSLFCFFPLCAGTLTQILLFQSFSHSTNYKIRNLLRQALPSSKTNILRGVRMQCTHIFLSFK